MGTDCFETNGVSVLRGIVPRHEISALKAVAEVAYSPAYLDLLPADSDYRRGFDSYRWVLMGDLQERIALHANFPSLVNRLRSVVSKETGRNAIYLQDMSFLRRIDPEHYSSARVPWHRDADAAGTWRAINCVNAWVPIDEVGNGAPTLQLVVGSHHRMRTIRTTYGNSDRSDAYEIIDDAYIAEHFPDAEIITPHLYPGDVVLFDHHTLHRTQPVSGSVSPRTSLECRMQTRALTSETEVSRLLVHQLMRLRRFSSRLLRRVGLAS